MRLEELKNPENALTHKEKYHLASFICIYTFIVILMFMVMGFLGINYGNGILMLLIVAIWAYVKANIEGRS